MSKEKIYVNGFRTFKKHEKAPSFVLGTLVITPNDFIRWLKENESYLTEYKGSKQLRCQILEGDKGIYFVVDTYKSEQGGTKISPKTDDLPF